MKDLISQGYAKVRYVEPTIEVITANSPLIASHWEMSKAHGVITKELWVLQNDGSAKLRVDNFEVLGKRYTLNPPLLRCGHTFLNRGNVR